MERDPRSVEIAEAICEIDFWEFKDYFQWKLGGEGDNGEVLIKELDIYWERKDRGGK